MKRVMRRLAGILLTVATIATVAFTFTTGTAAASHREAAHGMKADRHLCRSLDDLIRFLRHAPKPTALKSHEGRAVLAALDRGQPARVAASLHTVVWTFSRMRDGKSVTKRQDRSASDALFRTSVYAATTCKQKPVRAFAAKIIQARLAKAEAATSTTTRP
jgi:hypothetical protein